MMTKEKEGKEGFQVLFLSVGIIKLCERFDGLLGLIYKELVCIQLPVGGCSHIQHGHI